MPYLSGVQTSEPRCLGPMNIPSWLKPVTYYLDIHLRRSQLTRWINLEAVITTDAGDCDDEQYHDFNCC